jgi:hypothetical protein
MTQILAKKIELFQPKLWLTKDGYSFNDCKFLRFASPYFLHFGRHGYCSTTFGRARYSHTTCHGQTTPNERSAAANSAGI